MKLSRQLYFQVLVAVALGAICGELYPVFGANLRWIADLFVKLISMLISPIVFCTIVVGIGSMSDLKKVGRVGFKALLYFEVITTFALIIGLVIVNWVKPGAGIHANAAALGSSEIKNYVGAAHDMTVVGYLMHVVPTTLPGALTSGEIMQVLLVAILTGSALVGMGEKGKDITILLDKISHLMMGVVSIVVKLAPIAAFAAVAFTVGKFGLHTLLSLGSLMGCVLATMVLFVIFILGAVLRTNRISLWKFLRYMREEIILVAGTSSSETALPGLMAKMEYLGCKKSVVGLVVPAGYSFNLDGTSIYLTMAAVFIAQATDTPLSLGAQIAMLGVLLLTSKGAAAVTGGGFITLAATLGSTPVPANGLTLILGIDRFMSLARALTNLIGNGVAVVTVANWEGEFDHKRAQKILNGEPLEIGSEPVAQVMAELP